MRTKPQLRTKDIGVEANSYPFVPQDEWTYGVDYVHDWVHTKRGPVWMLIRRRQP
jgi:hypothetical protein